MLTKNMASYCRATLGCVLLFGLLASCDSPKTNEPQDLEATSVSVQQGNNATQEQLLARAIIAKGLIDEQALNKELETFKTNYVVSKYFQTFLAESVTTYDVESYYEKNIEKYTVNAVHAAHILFRVPPNATAEQRDAIKSKADTVLERLKKGEDFAVMANTASSDKISGRQGGSLGWIKESDIASEFTQVAFNLSVGEVSEVVLSQHGYHIVKVIQPPQKLVLPLEEVVDSVREDLRLARKQLEMARLLGESSDIQ